MSQRENIDKLDSKISGENILTFAAHPDGLEFYAGGTIAKLAKNNKVHFVIATNGENGSAEGEKSKSEVKKQRRVEQRKSAKILEVEKVEYLNFEDGELVADEKLKKSVLGVIKKFKPNILFTFDPWNMNQIHPDHRAIGFAVLDSVIKANMGIKGKRYKVEGIRSIYLYDTLRSNAFSDITKYWDRKLEANKSHKSQFQEFRGDWEEKREILEKIGKKYGGVMNIQYAEAFRKLEIDPSVRYINNVLYSLQHL